MNTGLPDSILHSIVVRLQEKENVIRAVIFGSRSRGDYKYNSDIDIAIYCNGKLPIALRLDLDKAAGIYKIDVVDMNSSLGEKLRQRIEEQGVEIYCSTIGIKR